MQAFGYDSMAGVERFRVALAQFFNARRFVDMVKRLLGELALNSRKVGPGHGLKAC